MSKIENLINEIKTKKNLNFEQSKLVFLEIMNGNMSESLIYDFLT